MDKNNFAQMEEALSECTKCYETVAANLDRAVARRDQERRGALSRAENAVKRLNGILLTVFWGLCAVAMYIVYKIVFGA